MPLSEPMLKIIACCANCGFEMDVFVYEDVMQQYRGQNKYILGGPCKQCKCQMFIFRIPTTSLLDAMLLT